MSFEVQETGWSCGLAALKFAHSLLGGGLRRDEELTEANVRTKAGLSRWRVFVDGTSEYAIKRAAGRLGLTARFRRYTRRAPARALADIKAATRRGHVAIVCVSSDDTVFFHWMVVAGFSGGKALVFDPAVTDHGQPSATYWLADPTGAYVPGLMAEARLQQWLDPGEDLEQEAAEVYGEQHMFVEIGVDPRYRDRFVPGMVDEKLVRQMRKDLDLAASFDDYIDALRICFGPPAWRPRAGDELASRFLRRHRATLAGLVRAAVSLDACGVATVEQELDNITAICRAYRFVVRRGQEPEVLAALALHLGWVTATATYEVEKFAA